MANLFTGFHHVAIRARDWDATVRFYQVGLGLKEKIRWGEGDKRAIMLDCGAGDYIEIFAGGKNERPKDAFPEYPILHFAIRTTNCDEAVAQALAAGAELTMPAKNINLPSTPGPTPIKIAFIKGLDGEVIEFFENDAT